jgi:large subunit ribosomal protein L29
MGIKPAEIKEMPVEELEQRLIEIREELFNLRFQNATGQLDNYSRLGELKRDIARLLTVMREREIAAAETPDEEGDEGWTAP